MSQKKLNFLKFLKEKENKEIPPFFIIKNKWEGYDDENIQLAAVQQDGHAIQFIENPSEEIQLAAVQENGGAIEYIIEKGITPSEQVLNDAKESLIRDYELIPSYLEKYFN